MIFLRLILTFSLVLNLGMHAAIPCYMKTCKLSKKVAACCKKETTQQLECCCAKMKCKTTIKHNDILLPVVQSPISLQNEYLSPQQVLITVNKVISFPSDTYFNCVNFPLKNNIPLLI